MKISSLRAENVHGYLPIKIDFFDDLTFLTGLNGSGKTSALRLIMALLSPNISELALIEFTSAEVDIFDNDKKIKIVAKKTDEGIEISISTISEKIRIGRAELELFLEEKRGEEPRSKLHEMYKSNSTFDAIFKISTPMFLGIDRRFFVPGSMPEDMVDIRRREYLARRFWSDEPMSKNTTPAASLIEVNYLVISCMQEIGVEQEKLDERLRVEFFTKAFEYKPGTIFGKSPKFPSREELEKYRKQLAKIGQASESGKIPVPEIQLSLTHFLERMSEVVNSLEKVSNDIKISKKQSKGTSEKFTGPDISHIEWIINKPQVDRITEHIKLLNEYIEKRTSLRDPINRFRLLVNKFLKQTNKELHVAGNGQLSVTVKNSNHHRSITALSSGEKQLLVMLAHLSLNKNLAGSGVFIVDEPELSLHMDWQEKFVDAIREANPNVQLILATHSPAIILDLEEACCSLSEA